MLASMQNIEEALRRNLDSKASVQPLTERLSAFLAGSFNLYEAFVLGETLTIAEPNDAEGSFMALMKRVKALERSLRREVALYMPTVTRLQRRALIEGGQAFVTGDGSFYLPQMRLSLTKLEVPTIAGEQLFSPSQQMMFLYCLYSDDGDLTAAQAQDVLGISAGSVSAALSLFVDLGMLDYATGGQTGRKKVYRIRDIGSFYRKGMKYFGTPIRRVIFAPTSVVEGDWLLAGLSALSMQSDLLPPNRAEYAVSTTMAKEIEAQSSDTLERCAINILKYDPALFAAEGCVDPLTMLLTIRERDERVSIALRQALGRYAWYQD